MKDIVERLRDELPMLDGDEWGTATAIAEEAAKEIERLRSRVKSMQLIAQRAEARVAAILGSNATPPDPEIG